MDGLVCNVKGIYLKKKKAEFNSLFKIEQGHSLLW
jgi:hypothetical protein